MADVAARYTGEGYHISHISPVNEPQYNWDSGQEGSGWTNDEVAALARELDMSLDDRGLSTDILLGESGDWEYLYKVKAMPTAVIYSQLSLHPALPPTWVTWHT